MQFPFSVSAPWQRRGAWALGILLLVWLLAWLSVPPLAKRLIEEKATAALGRKVTVGSVDFYPWSLELTLHNVAVATADGQAQQLAVSIIYIDGELESVLRMAPVADAITLEAPTLRLTHLGDGHYDVDDIVATLSKGADAKAASSPLQFALYNLTLNGGSVDFTDQLPSGVRQHAVRALHLAVPFLSTLSSKRDVKVEPRLAFDLNGSHFDTATQSAPFAQTRKADATIKISKLDLTPYLPYLPSSLPVRLQHAVVDADVHMGFEQAAHAKLTLKGLIRVSDLSVAELSGKALLDADAIAVEMAEVRPLDQFANLSSIEISAPKLQASRSRSGIINMNWGANAKESAVLQTSVPPAAHLVTGTKKAVSAPTPAKGWTLVVGRVNVHGGDVAWTDETMQPPGQLAATKLEVQAGSVHWPLNAKPFTFEASAQLPWRGKAALVALKGEGSAASTSTHVSVADLDLALLAPYSAKFLQPAVVGALDAELNLLLQGDALQVAVPHLAVKDFALKGPASWNAAAAAAATNAERAANEMPSFKLLEVSDATFDLTAHTGAIAKLSLRSPSVMAHRNAQGQWMVQRWLKSVAAVPTAQAVAVAQSDAVAPPVAPADTTPQKSPWQVALGEVVIADGTIKLDDRSFDRPARLEVSALQFKLNNAALDGSKAAPVTLSARLKAGRAEPGSLNYRGTVMWEPLALQGSVDAVDLPVHGIAPYFANHLNIAILRADVNYKGQLRYVANAQGMQLQLRGDAALEDFRANSVVGTPTDSAVSNGAAESAPAAASDDLGVAEELLSWKSLNAPGIALDIAPGTPTRLQVRETTLSDFYARIIVNPNGRMNLQDLVKPGPVGSTAEASNAGAETPAAPLAAEVNMGPMTLIKGQVLFSDRFIRPRYTANLSELNGKLSAFSSKAVEGTVQLADLELRGRAEGTAALEITGKINPLAKPLALDIRGRVSDLDLPPLTAYSVKYAGYGIERGKLSMDVHYAVQPDGQLVADNKLVLNQLSFGDAVEGAPSSLPVKLAVALLADSNGVIDINLPISGSLNDPQFKIGPLVWKVLTNLITKALTAPFSLIAHAFGGSDEDDMGSVPFAPGSSVLVPEAAQSLDKIAKALVEKPALRVTVVGSASLAPEREALKRERLKALLLAEKRRRAAVSSQNVGAVVDYTSEEYPVLLKDVYRRADIAKPRNLVGMAKDIPVAEMESLLLAGIAVTDEAMRALAQQRALVVKDYLASQKLGADRLFLGAPNVQAPDSGELPWKPRAVLSVTSH